MKWKHEGKTKKIIIEKRNVRSYRIKEKREKYEDKKRKKMEE